ncbi:MAG: 2-C-methyl-D-erythritol 4-phosphate cytidylyltransferase [Prevotellaceae bacterium]|jgi:2-C-methyl-D-erythritol 4-phosphate cytidylyltransferase|nr:2-C-methyl-D-erythritol 4-phosphate cytidylyltransferase [Prevotellaceae bacterium]
MKNAVIIIAGGIGLRMGNFIPKQFLLIKNKPVLMHTVEKFMKFDNTLDVILALPRNQIQTWQKLCVEYDFQYKHTIVTGGITRFHSVKNALEKISDDYKIIAVHDGVRPLVKIETIKKCFELAAEKGSAIPVIQINESLRRINGSTNEIVNRDGVYIVQTPQVFISDIIINSYKQAYVPEFTDDASVVEKSGYSINYTEGHRENIKITFPTDINFVEKFI